MTDDVEFKSWRCRIKEGRYANGRTRLDLIDAEDESPVATATVNLPGEPLAEGECFVKDHAENAGMVEALAKAGIAQPTGEWAVSGHVRVPKCRLIRPGR